LQFRALQSEAATSRFNVTLFEASVALFRQRSIQPQPSPPPLNRSQNSCLKRNLFIGKWHQPRLVELRCHRYDSGSQSRALQIGPCSHERLPFFSRPVHNFWVNLSVLLAIAFVWCFNSWRIVCFFLGIS